MKKRKSIIYILFCWSFLAVTPLVAATTKHAEFSADELRDKIRGGLLGQILGNLNGLQHEFKYIDNPGDVIDYTPSLVNGAVTDDDTDFEWVYIYTMQQENTVFLSTDQITDLWKKAINQRIWCSNLYARRMMDIGFKPPLTGNVVLNPWASFNISGQFLCETFGLLAPAMPQTAARIGLNYTRVAIDGEPAQTTQLFTSMIATAFISDDIEYVIKAGSDSIDEKSQLNEIVTDVKKWHTQFPQEWKYTRKLIKEKYTRFGGAMRDKNGYELNTASIIAALLYGKGEPAETLRIAFNFGWDADCNAATAGTIVGVIKGYRWMMAQDWKIVDRYKNTTRENMPEDETITSFADRLVDISERVIINNGGSRTFVEGNIVYKIPLEKSENIQKLPDFKILRQKMKKQFASEIKHGLSDNATKQQQAKAAYLAICLDYTGNLKSNKPEKWQRATNSLKSYRGIVNEMFAGASEYGIEIKGKAQKAGLN